MDRIDSPRRDDPAQDEPEEAAVDRADLEWDDEPGIFEVYDQAAEDRAIAEAREDIAAGRVVSHEKVVAWLKTWGTLDEKPYPREWFE